MQTRSRIIAGGSGYAGEPPDEALPIGVPHWMRFEILADLETELLRDQNLSSQNRMMAKVPINLSPSQREFTLSHPGLEDAVYATLTDQATHNMIPLPVEIGNIASIDRDARDGKRLIAFYSDRPQTGVLSWFPGGNETLTIWYDRSPSTNPSADQETMAITESYTSLLKLLLAAQMLELMKQPIGDFLKSRIARGMDQWTRFVKNGRQQGVITKTTYRTERFRAGNIWDAWPGRVPIE